MHGPEPLSQLRVGADTGGMKTPNGGSITPNVRRR